MIKDWHVRAVLSSEQNFLMESSKETYFREMGGFTYRMNFG